MRFNLKVFVIIAIILISVFALDATKFDFMLLNSIYSFVGYITSFSVWWPSSPAPDFVINETANFDAGFKANNSDGNFNIETYTDNLNIDEDTFELSNKYSDRFTYPHDFVADGNTWKWNYDSQLINDATWVTNEANININESGGFQIKQETDVSFADTYITTGLATGDIDFQTDFEWSSTGTDNAWLCFGFFDRPEVYDSTLFPICMYNEEGDMYFYAWSVTGADAFDVADDSYGKFRVSRTNTDTNEETFRFYFWDNVASDWELFLEDIVDSSVYEIADDDLYIGYFTETENTAGEALHNLDEFKVNSGTLGATTTNPYKETGNWTSDTITMTAGKIILNTTINLTASATNYLNKIEWYEGAVLIASNETDITTSGLVTYSTANGLTNGDLADIDSDFTIKLYLAGDGTGSPVIDDIIGYHYIEEEPPVSDFYQCYYSNNTGVNITDDVSYTYSGIVVNEDETLRCNDTEIYVTDVYDDLGEIENYGNLIFENFIIEFDLSSANTGYIYSEGVLTINNSVITSATGNDYFIADVSGATTIINNSHIEYAGWSNADYERGLELFSGYDIIQNTTLNNNYYGVVMHEDGITINNCSLISNTQNGIHLLSNNNTLTNNFFYTNYYDIYGNTESNLIENNSMLPGSESRRGVFFDSSSRYNTINNNTFTSDRISARGIDILGDYNTITSNTFYNIPSFGTAIRISSADYNIIENNYFYPDIKTMIQLSDSDFNEIRNNIFQEFDNYGISIEYGSTNNTVEWNNMTAPSSGDYGIYVTNSESNIIQHNIASHMGGTAGISVAGMSNHTLVYNNTVEYNYFYGIELYETYQVNVSHNIMSHSYNPDEGKGLWSHTSWDCIVEYNVAEWNADENIRHHDGGYHLIKFNNVSHSKVGLWNDWSVYNTYINNTIINSTDFDTNAVNMLTGEYFTHYNTTINTTTFSAVIYGNMEISEEPNPPTSSSDLLSLGPYLNITNTSVDSWISLNLTYDESDVVDEDRIILVKHDGVSWSRVTGSSVDTINNYVYGNVTSFSTFGVAEKTFYHCYYSNNTGIDITDGITIQYGEVLTCNDTDATVIGYIDNYGNLTIDNFDLTFDPTYDGEYGIWGNLGSTLTILEQSNITSSLEFNIYLGTEGNLTIKDSYFSSIGYGGGLNINGIYVGTESYNFTIKNNTITNGYSGIVSECYENGTIENNIIENMEGFGIVLINPYHIIVKNNTIISADNTGMYFAAPYESIIENNNVSYCLDGLYFAFSYPPVSPLEPANAYNVNVTGNIIKHISRDGIMGWGIGGMNFADNTIENITRYGYWLGVARSETTILRDNINDTKYGINFIADWLTINDTNITDSSEWDIYTTSYILGNNVRFTDTNATFEIDGVGIKNVLNPPTDDLDVLNVSSYINLTAVGGVSSEAYSFNLSYDDALAVNESRVRLFKYDGTNWTYVSSSVNADNNYVSADITSFSIFGAFEDTKFAINSITILPDEGDPGTVVNPTEDSNKTINVTVEFSNRTWVDMCYVRIFNSTENYDNPVYGPIEGIIQNCIDIDCECFVEWDMEHWRNPGTWNVSIDITTESGLSNFTSANFTYNELIALDVNTTTITFTGNPGQTVMSDDAYPLRVKNTGNQIFDVSVNGTDFQGQVRSEYIIGTGNATYNETTSGTFKILTHSYEDVFVQMTPALIKLLYFKGNIPNGFLSQAYRGYVEFKVN